MVSSTTWLAASHRVSPVKENFKPKNGSNITRAGFQDIFSPVSIHPDEAPNAFFLPFGRVIDRRALFQLSRIDPQVSQATNIRVGNDFKDQCTKRFRIVCRDARLPSHPKDVYLEQREHPRGMAIIEPRHPIRVGHLYYAGKFHNKPGLGHQQSRPCAEQPAIPH